MKRWLFRVCASLVVFFVCRCGSLHAQTNPSPNRPPSGSASSVDLNGIWEGVAGTPGSPGDHRTYRFLLYQIRNTIQLYTFDGYPLMRSGVQMLTTDMPVPAELPAKIPADIRSSNDGRMWWYHSVLWVDGPDDLRLFDVHKIHRIRKIEVQDIPCDPANSAHVSGVDAFHRGNAYFLLNDLTTANCWFRVGAVEGNGYAQASYAYSLLHARGIAQNVKEAKVWAQRSAEQRNPFGEFNLASIIATAKASNLLEAIQGGFALVQADELIRRYRLHDPNQVFTGDRTAPLEPAIPTFEKDSDFRYDFTGEFRVNYPPEAPRHPVFAVVVLQKNTDFQLIVGDPNIYYPAGESMFNGHYVGGENYRRLDGCAGAERRRLPGIRVDEGGDSDCQSKPADLAGECETDVHARRRRGQPAVRCGERPVPGPGSRPKFCGGRLHVEELRKRGVLDVHCGNPGATGGGARFGTVFPNGNGREER